MFIALRLFVGCCSRLESVVQDAGIGENVIPALLQGNNQSSPEQGFVELGIPFAERQRVGSEPVAGKRLFIGERNGCCGVQHQFHAASLYQ